MRKKKKIQYWLVRRPITASDHLSENFSAEQSQAMEKTVSSCGGLPPYACTQFFSLLLKFFIAFYLWQPPITASDHLSENLSAKQNQALGKSVNSCGGVSRYACTQCFSFLLKFFIAFYLWQPHINTSVYEVLLALDKTVRQHHAVVYCGVLAQSFDLQDFAGLYKS